MSSLPHAADSPPPGPVPPTAAPVRNAHAAAAGRAVRRGPAVAGGRVSGSDGVSRPAARAAGVAGVNLLGRPDDRPRGRTITVHGPRGLTDWGITGRVCAPSPKVAAAVRAADRVGGATPATSPPVYRPRCLPTPTRIKHPTGRPAGGSLVLVPRRCGVSRAATADRQRRRKSAPEQVDFRTGPTLIPGPVGAVRFGFGGTGVPPVVREDRRDAGPTRSDTPNRTGYQEVLQLADGSVRPRTSNGKPDGRRLPGEPHA